MPFTGGSFSLYTPGNPVVTGTTISSTWANNTLNDIATGLSTTVLKNGNQTLTANIPFSGFKITGLGNGTALTDGANLYNVQVGSTTYLSGVAGTNTITATATPTPAYVVGQRFTFVPAVTNTGATTLNISSVGAGAVQWAGAALTGGELVAGTPVTVLVTATTPVFEIINATQFPDTRALVVGGTDATKKLRFEVDGLTTATTRVATFPDKDGTVAMTSDLVAAASQAEQETGTATTVYVSPGRQQFHASAVKAWGKITAATTVDASYPAAGVSINNSGTGVYVVTHGLTFSSANYAVNVTVSGSSPRFVSITARTTTTFTVTFYDNATVAAAVIGFDYACSGDL